MITSKTVKPVTNAERGPIRRLQSRALKVTGNESLMVAVFLSRLSFGVAKSLDLNDILSDDQPVKPSLREGRS
jgi:hypothetical protein